MKHEHLYISDEFYAEIEALHLRYKMGEIKVPPKFKGRRLTKNLVYLIALDEHFTKKHNFKSSPIEK